VEEWPERAVAEAVVEILHVLGREKDRVRRVREQLLFRPRLQCGGHGRTGPTHPEVFERRMFPMFGFEIGAERTHQAPRAGRKFESLPRYLQGEGKAIGYYDETTHAFLEPRMFFSECRAARIVRKDQPTEDELERKNPPA
jgi:hypothetical protein